MTGTVNHTSSLRRTWNVYSAIAAMVPRMVAQYNVWFWVDIFTNIVGMVIFVYFWRAIYAETPTIGGLVLGQTLNYVLLARAIGGTNGNGAIWRIGYSVRSGDLATEFLRPVDYQASMLVQDGTSWGIQLVLRLPLLIAAYAAFGLEVNRDPLAYLAFLVTFVLGGVILFLADWLIACLTFYTTEIWGFLTLKEGAQAFFSGYLIPLDMLPGTLRDIAGWLPFSQATYVPLSFLSGIQPSSNLPRVILVQLAYITVLLVVSRLAFARASRAITVQGG